MLGSMLGSMLGVLCQWRVSTATGGGFLQRNHGFLQRTLDGRRHQEYYMVHYTVPYRLFIVNTGGGRHQEYRRRVPPHTG